MSKREFYCELLEAFPTNHKLIQNFKVDREHENEEFEDQNIFNDVGLEAYLKLHAWEDNKLNLNKIFVIKDSYVRSDIVCYFALKSGMVGLWENGTLSEDERKEIWNQGIKSIPDSIPAIELAQFAINDNYRRIVSKDPQNLIKGLGSYIFPEFVFPLVKDVQSKIGAKMLYLFAAGGDSLIKTYEREEYGFSVLEENFLMRPLRIDYDDSCTFMYRYI